MDGQRVYRRRRTAGALAGFGGLLVLLAMATGCKEGQGQKVRKAIALPELYWKRDSRCRAEQRETGQDCDGEGQPADHAAAEEPPR